MAVREAEHPIFPEQYDEGCKEACCHNLNLLRPRLRTAMTISNDDDMGHGKSGSILVFAHKDSPEAWSSSERRKEDGLGSSRNEQRTRGKGAERVPV